MTKKKYVVPITKWTSLKLLLGIIFTIRENVGEGVFNKTYAIKRNGERFALYRKRLASDDEVHEEDIYKSVSFKSLLDRAMPMKSGGVSIFKAMEKLRI